MSSATSLEETICEECHGTHAHRDEENDNLGMILCDDCGHQRYLPLPFDEWLRRLT